MWSVQFIPTQWYQEWLNNMMVDIAQATREQHKYYDPGKYPDFRTQLSNVQHLPPSDWKLLQGFWKLGHKRGKKFHFLVELYCHMEFVRYIAFLLVGRLGGLSLQQNVSLKSNWNARKAKPGQKAFRLFWVVFLCQKNFQISAQFPGEEGVLNFSLNRLPLALQAPAEKF